jgi:hypothetical protein
MHEQKYYFTKLATLRTGTRQQLTPPPPIGHTWATPAMQMEPAGHRPVGAVRPSPAHMQPAMHAPGAVSPRNGHMLPIGHVLGSVSPSVGQ